MEPYTLLKNGTAMKRGVTDAHGRVLIKDHQPSTDSYKVKLANGNAFELPVGARLNEADQKLAAQGYRAAQDTPQSRLQHYLHFRGGEQDD
jgi:type VI secretion system secreted protein VgrG